MLINLGKGHWANPVEIRRIWVDGRRFLKFGSKRWLWVEFHDGDEFFITHPTQQTAEAEANRIANEVNRQLAPLHPTPKEG